MIRRVILPLLLLGLVIPGSAHAQDVWRGSYPEGPAWIDGTLYWAEMGADKVMRWDGTDPEPAWQKAGCGPTAIARYRQDLFAVLCHFDGSIMVLDRDFKLLRRIKTAADGTQLRNPNDVSADGKGGVWFTDPGPFDKSAGKVGAVYYLAPDGTLTRHAEGLFYGNGIHVDRAGQRVLVSEHLARRVLEFPLTADGLGPSKVLFELDSFGLPPARYENAGPDGLEIGPGGILWFAEYGTGRLLGWDPDHGLVAGTATDAQFITNIAFGPNGLVVVTAPENNSNPPFPGRIWVFKIDELNKLITK